jgi:hypothetical protein
MIIELLVLVVLVLVVTRIVLKDTRKRKARAEADRIITGKQLATEAQINKCITVILSVKSWAVNQTESDRERVKRLRNIREEMVTPHS